MSNIDTRVSRCSNDDDAIHRANDFNARTLERSRAFLDGTQKPAWHRGFRAIIAAAKARETRVSRKKFSPREKRARCRLDDSPQAKIFFTAACGKRTEERN